MSDARRYAVWLETRFANAVTLSVDDSCSDIEEHNDP